MARFAPCPASLLLFTAMLTVLSSCGAGRQLQSVTVSPAAADAKDFPNGVLFTATGTFSKPPSPVMLTSNDVFWCVATPGDPQAASGGHCAGISNTEVNLDQNGLAQCFNGFTGTATILAGKLAPSNGVVIQGPEQLTVFSSAKLTCP